MTLDPQVLLGLEAWIGRGEQSSDVIAVAPARALAATLDRDGAPLHAGDPLPPAFQWLYFLAAVPQSQLGIDGHPERGGFLPPVPLPRRMWAASRMSIESPLRLGEPATRASEITDVRTKQGRSGPLVFVTLRHIYRRASGAMAIVEEQDIVYRDHAAGGDAAPAQVDAPIEAPWMRELRPDAALLFRYSALTFNSHRIHYDRPYATGVEGYPSLVVHGPLVATLLLDLLHRHRPEARVSRFEFRAHRPLFEGAGLLLCGAPSADQRQARLWACDARGIRCMEACATLNPNTDEGCEP